TIDIATTPNYAFAPQSTGLEVSMFCRFCGTSLPEDSTFCQSCGKSLAAASTAIGRDGAAAAPALAPSASPLAEPKKEQPRTLLIAGAVLIAAFVIAVAIFFSRSQKSSGDTSGAQASGQGNGVQQASTQLSPVSNLKPDAGRPATSTASQPTP